MTTLLPSPYPRLDEATLTLEAVRERLKVFTEDKRFHFDPEPHIYTLAGRQLTSATGLVGQFHKPFDRVGQAPKTARKLGWTVEQVLADWDYSAFFGTVTHDHIEHDLPRWFYSHDRAAHVPAECHDPESRKRIAKYEKLRDTRLVDLEPVALELRMFHEAAGLSGTLDYLAWHRPTGKLYVLDWKTSKVVKMDGDDYFDSFHAPFADLPVIQHNEYSLQTSVYRLFLESVGIPTAGAAIVHLPPDKVHQTPDGGSWVEETDGKIIQCKDFRDRLRFLFQ